MNMQIELHQKGQELEKEAEAQRERRDNGTRGHPQSTEKQIIQGELIDTNSTSHISNQAKEKAHVENANLGSKAHGFA